MEHTQEPILENSQRTFNIPFLNQIVCGDSRQLIKQIPSNSIDLVITSPPYFQQREYMGGGIGVVLSHFFIL